MFSKSEFSFLKFEVCGMLVCGGKQFVACWFVPKVRSTLSVAVKLYA